MLELKTASGSVIVISKNDDAIQILRTGINKKPI